MPWTQQQGMAQPNVNQPADIVFVLDSSGSMQSCFDGLKDHVDDFVAGLETDAGTVDFRLALITANIEIFRWSDFVDSTSQFRRYLEKTGPGRSNEYTLPAIDFALDMDWRHKVHKIVVLFTDEPVDDGYDPEVQRRKLPELIDKAKRLHTKLFLYTPPCDAFSQLTDEVPGSVQTIVDSDSSLYNSDFQGVLKRLAATVSSSIAGAGNPQLASTVPRNLYGLGGGDMPDIRKI